MQQLAWLPTHPDLGSAITAVRALPNLAERLAAVGHLAGFRRDFVATGRLDRILADALANPAMPDTLQRLGLAPLRVALLASHTVDHLVPGLRVAALARRLALQVEVAPYGLYRQVLLDPASPLEAFRPQVVVLALDARDAALDLPLDASVDQVEAAVTGRVAELRHLWARARERFGARVVQQTLLDADPPLFGSFDALVPASPAAVLDRLNRALRDAAREDGALLLDLAWEAPRHGGEGWADPVRWHQGKQLVSPLLSPLHGDLLARVLAATAGLSRKCLVLDLDNTLWGGVVGDDGVEGLRLGQGDPVGEAFLAVQRYAAQLARRGIILAVCSKNDPAIAEAAFASHPEMVLKPADIAAFVANWDDKAGNLRTIAKRLNIGLDSLVFVDDNPAERDIVRRELPMVAVPELPEDVAYYPATIAAAGYFEAAGFTPDDATRARSYAQNAERLAALEQTTDMEGYLRGLAMTLVARPVSGADLVRVTQLTNKTNQFNLTTQRRTEAEVEALAADPANVALSFRLTDRFGDNGLVGVVLARPDAAWPEDVLLIDTWLMSCRVLGRGVEAASLGVLAAAATQRGARTLVGEYRPTAKNRLVRDHYANLGFASVLSAPGAAAGATFWRYDLDAATLPQHFMEVKFK